MSMAEFVGREYRALQVSALSNDFSGTALVTQQIPAIADDAVLIRVKAASLNFPDVLMTQGTYQFKPELPFVPGLEASGEVVAVGQAVAHVRVGDAVIAMVRQGGLAEYLIAKPHEVRRMPANLSWAQGASYSVAGLTAYVALVSRGQAGAKETLVVHGATGGTGLAAVQLGKHLGMRVIATGRSLAKLEIARQMGADHLIEISTALRDDVLAATQGRGADVVFDPIGGDVFDASVRALAWGGRLLVIGFVSGDAGQVRSNYALIKGISIVGVRAGEFVRRDPERGQAALAAIDGLAAQGVLLPPIGEQFAFADAKAALERLASGSIAGKLVVSM